MAITIKQNAAHGLKGPVRGQRGRTFLITPDASKPAGGYTILASDLGFTYLDFGLCAQPAAGIYQAGFQIGTASTNGTLQYFNVSCTATNVATDVGTAVAASVAGLSTNPVGLYVIGR